MLCTTYKTQEAILKHCQNLAEQAEQKKKMTQSLAVPIAANQSPTIAKEF